MLVFRHAFSQVLFGGGGGGASRLEEFAGALVSRLDLETFPRVSSLTPPWHPTSTSPLPLPSFRTPRCPLAPFYSPPPFSLVVYKKFVFLEQIERISRTWTSFGEVWTSSVRAAHAP